MPFALLLGPIAGCGYQPLARALPGDVRRVLVAVPDPSRTDEPALAPALAAELVRQLGRHGVAASTAGRAEARLAARVVSLETADAPLDSSGQRVGARLLRLRLELRLSAAGDDRTLWRSGLITVEELWPLGSVGVAPAETARRLALQRLAQRAAEQAAELLTSGL